jgi:hypothetical protein
MKGRPFVLLGVNSDGDKEKLKKRMAQEGITWRSWWEGVNGPNQSGPIASLFNVHAWPTFYLLDDKGVIREKLLGSVQSKRWNAAIDALVKATEESDHTSQSVPKEPAPPRGSGETLHECAVRRH